MSEECPFMQPAPIHMETADSVSGIREAEEKSKLVSALTDRKLAERESEDLAEEKINSLRQIVSIRGDAIAIRRTRWLWKNRIPVGGLALVAGKGDVSKSTLLAQFVAWLTTGRMYGEYEGIPQDVGYVVNEDSLPETVVPRMKAHGADMSRVHFLHTESPKGAAALSLPRDGDLLRNHIRDNNLIATFIDPLSANITGRRNDQGDMRATYQEVNKIAEDTRSAIVGLAHTRKAGAADVMEAIIGSSEQGNVARSVHGLVMDPEEDGARILSCEKLNVGQKHLLPSLRFTLDTIPVECTDGPFAETTDMPVIHWLEETGDTASDVLSDQYHGNQGIDKCTDWLSKYLMDNGGEAYAGDIQEAGKKFSTSMLRRARLKLGVKSKRTKEVPSRTVWAHPTNTQSDS